MFCFIVFFFGVAAAVCASLSFLSFVSSLLVSICNWYLNSLRLLGSHFTHSLLSELQDRVDPSALARLLPPCQQLLADLYRRDVRKPFMGLSALSAAAASAG